MNTNPEEIYTEFDPVDIGNNKVVAVLGYLIFLIPLLAAGGSKFARYHANQGLVLLFYWIVAGFVSGLPIIGWFILGPVLGLIGLILIIIGMANAGSGQAKPLPMIGGIKIIR